MRRQEPARVLSPVQAREEEIENIWKEREEETEREWEEKLQTEIALALASQDGEFGTYW